MIPNLENMLTRDAGIDRDGHPTQSPLPPIRSAKGLAADIAVAPPPEVVAGILHQGCKGILGSSSKARKTWILLNLALCVASGKPFWKWRTNQGRVLYINFEIMEAFLKSRLVTLCTAMGMSEMPERLDLWTLRGRAASLGTLLPELIRTITAGKYSLIVIDPIYKGLGGRDENAAGDIAELCNELERLAVATGAAVVFAAHYSKGNQSGKEAMDRIGGSGVFARDADTIITMTALNEDDALGVEVILRNHPEQEPFAIRWKYPLMVIDEDMNPHDLKRPAAKNDKVTPSEDDFTRLFKTDDQNPRACLMTAQEMRSAFRARRWNDLDAPALRDAAEGCGRLKIYHGAHNQKLTGLPAMVDAYIQQQKNKGTILDQPALATQNTAPRRKKGGKK